MRSETPFSLVEKVDHHGTAEGESGPHIDEESFHSRTQHPQEDQRLTTLLDWID